MKVLLVTASLLLLGSVLNSCDEIGMPYEKKGTVKPPDTTKVAKKVFVEEFTGCTCKNCPDGHRTIDALRQAYGSAMITMEIHSGGFAEPEPPKYPADFRTPTGDLLASTFAVSSYPSGLVNRESFGGDFLQARTAWASDVDSATRETAKIKLSVTPTYTASSGDLAIDVTATALSAFSTTNPLNVIVYVVEDSIVAPQLDGSTYVSDYLHRDVLRDAPLGTFGTPISSATSWASGFSATNTVHTSLSGKTWNLSHLKVIALIAEQTPSYIIWQAEESAIQ